ncbi:MAG: hypothetical protein GY949_10625 [Gammaproteobacteria bacterium]|nr:hypothetical protein [Gammaproteobacteria bacterium]
MSADRNQEELLSSIVLILEEHLGEEYQGKLKRDTNLESVDIESIDMVEIVFNIEDKYDINVPLEEVAGAVTVGDLADRLAKILEGQKQA